MTHRSKIYMSIKIKRKRWKKQIQAINNAQLQLAIACIKASVEFTRFSKQIEYSFQKAKFKLNGQINYSKITK